MLEQRSSISFDLTGNEGAALLTKHLTFSEDIQLWGIFEKYAKVHYSSWIKFARACGHGDDVKPVLVTGVDMTRDFAMMSYSNDSENLNFTAEFKMSVSGVPFPWGTWTKPGAVYTNCGPGPRRPPSRTQTVDPEPPIVQPANLEFPIAQTVDPEPPLTQTEDPESFVTQAINLEPSTSGRAETSSDAYHQCIFIRYYAVRTGLRIPKVMKAGAGPHDLGPGNRDNHDPGSPLEARCSSDSGSDTVPSPFDDNGDDDGSSITSIDSQESDIVTHNTAIVGSPPFLSVFARPIDPL